MRPAAITPTILPYTIRQQTNGQWVFYQMLQDDQIIRRHYCRTAKFSWPEDSIGRAFLRQRSYTIPSQTHGRRLQACPLRAQRTQRHCSKTERYWSQEATRRLVSAQSRLQNCTIRSRTLGVT